MHYYPNKWVLTNTLVLGYYMALKGGDIIITFQAFREYMKVHGKSIYSLTRDHVIGGATLDKIRADSQGITLDTINSICNYLNCKPSDIITYTRDKGPGE